MQKKDITVSFRVDETIDEEVKRYAEANDISKSDAIRKMLKKFLKDKKD